MKDSYLYAGKVLWVDLTSGKFWTTPTAAYAERFLVAEESASGSYGRSRDSHPSIR